MLVAMLILFVGLTIVLAIMLDKQYRETRILIHRNMHAYEELHEVYQCIRNLPEKIYDKDGNPYHKFYYGQMEGINYVSDSNLEEVFPNPESIGSD